MNTSYSCLFNYFLIHYFDTMNSPKSDQLHFDSLMNSTNYESISVTWANQNCIPFQKYQISYC